jgi:hypothetical protein
MVVGVRQTGLELKGEVLKARRRLQELDEPT